MKHSSKHHRWRRGGLGLVSLALLSGAVGCAGSSSAPGPRNVTLHQTWVLQPGDRLAGYQVQSGLGDITVNLRGNQVFMPFDGLVQPAAANGDLCVILSSPDVPAYLFRLCGLRRVRLGDLPQGDPIGKGNTVAFATLRRQADGTWAMVEPAKEMLAQFLDRP
ncbi:hypothetical protein [Nodosilinea sp. E11]|uniref:hypothetical protein n=1 Tax=Nodosilinea sp. E11 TaxID=3037479 RepID=UPI002934C446|nr:hypothetical protein [Nodosilinea sp. E11]WOD40486.1 hypothetical protein RRF56_06730 [Nodosilinea sp. E11]